ncbi:hypothetical protein N8873_05495 [Flavobacteriaceae bacterium]|nr:hypothetical protein [Flavobacteriaceae bacterium]
MKNYKSFPFEERKRYEETFVENNSALIEELTGASRVFDISQTPMDKRAGVDAILQFDRGLSGVALRIRKPQYKKFSKRFTIGHHISQPNSQIHCILNSTNDSNVFYPHLVLQVNGVDEEGYCEECYAIMLQTNVFANYLKELIKTNTLEDYYNTVLNAYEFEFTEVFYQTDTGVDLFHIQNNNIKYVKTHEESS